jgi:hypothetical protein
MTATARAAVFPAFFFLLIMRIGQESGVKLILWLLHVNAKRNIIHERKLCWLIHANISEDYNPAASWIGALSSSEASVTPNRSHRQLQHKRQHVPRCGI